MAGVPVFKTNKYLPGENAVQKWSHKKNPDVIKK